MKIEDIKDLFPITTMVTQEIIDKSNLYNIHDCIGSNTLRSVLPIELHDTLHWGRTNGYVYSDNLDDYAYVTSNIDMMEITKPIEVTLTI